MNSKRIITVLGATGAQGGGLARAILADPQQRFALRAISRRPDAPAARALAAQGASVVAADLDDPASLVAAFRGSYGLFAVTNFWAHMSPQQELLQAENIATAARQVGVRHLLWSTLEDTREFIALDDPRMPNLQGRYKVPHYDAKGEADAFFRALPTTFLRSSFYWENLIHFGMAPQRGGDGVLEFLLPMGERRLPGIAAADIGACALALFGRGESVIGQTVGIAGEHLSGAEMAAALSRALGETVRHRDLPFSAYAALGFPGAEDLANMFQFKHDCHLAYRAQRPVEATRALYPSLLDFSAWLRRHAAEIPRPAAVA